MTVIYLMNNQNLETGSWMVFLGNVYPSQNSLIVSAGSALIMHQITRRYEPKTSTQMLSTAFLLPVIFTVLLHTCSTTPTSRSFASILLQLLLINAVYSVTFLISILIYRLAPWHPLSSYPGPLRLCISKFFYIWRTRRGNQYIYIKTLHDKYGDYVRTGPNDISIRNVEAVIPVLGATGFPKGPALDGRNVAAPRPEQRSITNLREPDLHMERRKLWNKGFNSAALKDYEAIVIRRGKQLVEALEARKNRVDISTWIGYFTFDFMGDMAFGGGFELLRDGGDKEGVWTILQDSLPVQYVMAHAPWAATLIHQFTHINKNVLTLRSFAATPAKKRLSEGSFSRDLWHHLYERDNALSKHPISRMTSEATTAIVAGSDTTRTILSNICYFMCQHPIYLVRLQAEIDQMFPGFEEPFDSMRLSQMTLLNAVINEALRLSPPVPSGTQRCVLPRTDGKFIGTNYIPAGTQVTVRTYCLHRDPRCFSPHPDEFWPDRWLAESDRQFPNYLFGSNASRSAMNASVILNHTAFIPFSFGPANCVGKNLALMEMRMIVSLIFQKFGIRFAKGYDAHRWLNEQEDWSLMKVGELDVELTPRF